MSRLIQRAGLAGAVLLVMFLTQGTAFAEIATDPKNNARGNRLVGIWDVDVVVGPCGVPPVAPPFQALHMYAVGGTGQVVPSSNPAVLSAHLLVWEHVGGNQYRASMKFYRYQDGVAVGYNIITNELTVSEDGTGYAGHGVAEIFTMDGMLLNTVCPQFAGTRFTG